MSRSAVQFPTSRRIHIGLAVSSVERSVEFYRELLDAGPTKTRNGYARFEVSEPLLNLSVIESQEAKGPADATSHFGIQVQSISAVSDMRRRLESAGLAMKTEEAVICCHAVQDKIWIVDPDGHRWEVFVVLDDDPNTAQDESTDCCPTTGNEACCTAGGESCCSETR